MGIIEALDNTSTAAVDKGEAYIKTTKKYYELKVFQQLALLSVTGCKLALYFGLCILGLIFLAVAGASAIGDYFDNASIGYLFVSVLFFGLIGIIYLVRNRIEKMIIHKLSENFFD